MVSKILITIGVMAALIGALVITAMALFTDTQSVPANAFTTGTIDISTSPITTLVTFSNMLPGDQVTAPITVTNAGANQLRYAITSTTTENTLAAQLDLTAKSGVTTCTSGGFGSSGTVIYATGDLGNTTAVNIVGDPAQGAQAGDRPLNGTANETLCFNVSLPLATGNTYQGLTSTADRKSTRLNSSHLKLSRMPSSA